jgi:glycosyltransferase involved in cell wall biosynthesis
VNPGNESEQGEVELSVIVPAFNEAATIAEAVCRLDAELRRQPRSYEVTVVSDGSTDGTPDIVSDLALPDVSVVHYPENQGKGYAIKTGGLLARGEIVAFIDGDLDIHPSGLMTLIDQLQSTGVDAVVASKVHKDSVVQYPAFRRLQSRVFRLIVKALFSLDIADTQTGLKVFRASVLRECLPNVTTTGYAFDLELLVLAGAAGYKVAEGPVELDYQFSTTTGASAVLTTLHEVWRIFRTARTHHQVATEHPGPSLIRP